MLSQNEKDILGIMVDMGRLKGEERVSAGSSDEIARDVIAAFKERMMATLPQRIEQIEAQETFARTQKEALQAVLVAIA